MLTDVVPVQPEWQDGYLLPPTRPGLGIEFDREAAKKHPFQMAELPHLRRLDGVSRTGKSTSQRRQAARAQGTRLGRFEPPNRQERQGDQNQGETCLAPTRLV